MNLNEALIKLMIAEEVRKQVNPLAEEVQDIGKRLRSFYSNGSGGPPGALEIWREEDKKQFAELKKQAEVSEANNDTFLKFISLQQTKEANLRKWKKRIWDFTKIAAPILGSAFLGLCGFVYHKAAPVVHIIIDDYIQAHPEVHRKLKEQHTVSDLPSTYVR